MGEDNQCVIVVREFDPSKDLTSVEEVEKRCEVGPSGKLSLFTDLLGDPICRVRHSPAFLMLVQHFLFCPLSFLSFSITKIPLFLFCFSYVPFFNIIFNQAGG